eukprot:978850-Pelagomonas_calceolata.AAC.1
MAGSEIAYTCMLMLMECIIRICAFFTADPKVALQYLASSSYYLIARMSFKRDKFKLILPGWTGSDDSHLLYFTVV